MFLQLGSSLVDSSLIDSSVELSFSEGLTILFASLVFGFYLRFLYWKLAITFSSKVSFGNTILIVTISVASLVAVVKASLALSLGLVGALSVIRFRTAVKEPYNLSYILLAICVGISIGASQYLFSLLIILFGTLAVVLAYKSEKSRDNKLFTKSSDDIDTIYLNLPSNSSLDELQQILVANTKYFSIVSLDQAEGESLTVVFKVKLNNFESLSKLKKILFDKFPKSEFRFFNNPEF